MNQPMIHVVDDDQAMRESLAFLMASADLASRTYDSARALLDGAAALESGCIVTDIRMPGMNGLEMMRELNARGIAHPVIVLTGHADVALAVDAMKAGAVDFLEKPFDDDALLGAIRAAVAQGEGAAARLAERSVLAERLAQLTGRERDVFCAITEGDSNKAAALRLGISPRTVEIYRANVMAKMQASSLSELVRMAMQVEQA